MSDSLRFAFTNLDPSEPGSSWMPWLSFNLLNGEFEAAVTGLLDTGAMVNVLPYSIGVQLGLDWDQQRVPIILSGNLARVTARGVVVSASVGHFETVRLAFAWAQTDDVPLLLGQINFFAEFDVCFFRSELEFEIRQKTAP
jgi:hypothetical protein